MMRQFKVALAITFGETNPKPAVERSDEEYSKHADAVALILSPNPLPTQPPAEALDSIPVDGGVFFVVRGEKVNSSHVGHLRHFQTL
jgi:hypothetical protein